MSEWEDFERAVAAFVKALTPGARVTHNARLPDRHTGRLRQRDVWIEARIGPFPVNILVSCKWLKRKINEQDLDAFIGELSSSGAHKGVLYSLAGFTAPAIAKARSQGISCCKLYRNEPAELPDSLFLTLYCCAGSFAVQLNPEALEDWGDATLEEVLALSDNTLGPGRSVLDMLIEDASAQERVAIEQTLKSGTLPQGWTSGVTIEAGKPPVVPLQIGLDFRWRVYRARLEGHMLDGTYSFTEGSFFGRQQGPVVDLKEGPGPGWELITNPPTKIMPQTGVIVLQGADVRKQLVEALGTKTFRAILARESP
jgi:hypothetical protein